MVTAIISDYADNKYFSPFPSIYFSASCVTIISGVLGDTSGVTRGSRVVGGTRNFWGAPQGRAQKFRKRGGGGAGATT